MGLHRSRMLLAPPGIKGKSGGESACETLTQVPSRQGNMFISPWYGQYSERATIPTCAPPLILA